MKQNEDCIEFTNSKLRFIRGEEELPAGIVSVTIGVEGERRLEEILWRAKADGLTSNEVECVEMLGIRWNFILVDGHVLQVSKL